VFLKTIEIKKLNIELKILLLLTYNLEDEDKGVPKDNRNEEAQH